MHQLPLFDARNLVRNAATPAAVKDLIRMSDIIACQPISDSPETLVFGHDAIVQALSPGESGFAVRKLIVGVHAGTDDFDRLLYLVKRIKGRHDYIPRRPAAIQVPQPTLKTAKAAKRSRKRLKALQRVLATIEDLRADDDEGATWLIGQLTTR